MNHRAHLHSFYLPKSASGTPYLRFHSLQGFEGISALFEYKLIIKAHDEHGNPAHGIKGLEGYVSHEAYHGSIIHPKEGDPSSPISYQSVASHLDLTTLIGTPLGISLDLNDKHPIDNRTITGAVHKHALIASVTELATRNRHATYELLLVPWLYLLTKTNNYHIHQHKSIPQIIEAVLSCYPYPWQFHLTGNYPSLDYQTQYDESDYAFITRLMSEHGMSFYFEHTKDSHTLIITDHASQLKRHSNPFYDTLTLYPPNQRMPEFAEYLEYFTQTQSLVTAQHLLSDYQFKTPSTPLIAHDTMTAAQTDATKNPHQALIYHLQRYKWHQGRRVHEEALTSLNKTLMNAEHQDGLKALGQGRLKGLQVGCLFTLNNHPRQDCNTDWLIMSLTTHIKPIDEDNNTHQYYTADTSFIAHLATHPLVPKHIHPRPIARTQTATVVAPEGEEIHTDQYGRIKVKFHWDKPTLTQRHLLDNDPSYNQNNQSTSSPKDINTCYLRVSTPWAGDHFGQIALPRVGQEVIVDFFGGNPDMPYVTGSLTNPNNMPPWELPGEQVLSGIRSKEHKGEQSNQLVMDDTKGKLQTQLKSDHLHTEVNLGHIRRLTTPKGRGEYRGEGFEVRSDGHGVIRAGRGMIITTHGRQEAVGAVKDVGETVARLQTMIDQHSLLLEQAIEALCELRPIDKTVICNLKRQLRHIMGEPSGDDDDQYPEVTTPQVIISSQSDIIATAKEDIHLAAQGSFSMTASKDVSLATMSNYNLTSAKATSLFSHRGGIKLYANQGKVELQAQNDSMAFTAKKDIEISSTEQTIDMIASKQIRLRCEGAQILMNKDGITFITDGTFKVKANQHDLQQGQAVGVDLQGLPIVDLFNEKFQILSPTGKPMPFVDYRLSSKDKSFLSSTQNDGQTKEIHTKEATDLYFGLQWMTLECDESE